MLPTPSDSGASNLSTLAAQLAAAFPTLAAAPAATLERIARVSVHRIVPAGTVMFSEHSPCGGFPLVLSGSIRVVQRYANGRELQLYRVKPGESCLMSGTCLLGNAEYEAAGIAESEVDLLIVPAAEFHALVDEDPTFRRHVFALFSERLSSLMQVVEAIASQKLDQRLAALLVNRAPDGEIN